MSAGDIDPDVQVCVLNSPLCVCLYFTWLAIFSLYFYLY